ncbi:thermonuclease family protein [Brackiella oedipodis]|uniref:thermonuclease family protein n=1 Tax=Brackiella oedipodis TaxID=124225 RepID=UPI00146F9C2D|nr:thermonuclease family protein [Brackiella oedipodis]
MSINSVALKLLLPLCLSLCLWLSPLPCLAMTLVGKVVHVADADTITVLDDQHQQHRVRFKHIDAPEKGQAFGRVAQQALSKKIALKDVQIETQGRDRYGRWLGEVYYHGENINLWLVQNGYAWAYMRYHPPFKYILAQKKAQFQKLGLWQDPHPVEPEKFRWSAHKKK